VHIKSEIISLCVKIINCPVNQGGKNEAENGFPDYIEKAETGAVVRALAMCGYGTLQAPEFDEGERISDTPIETKEKSG